MKKKKIESVLHDVFVNLQDITTIKTFNEGPDYIRCTMQKPKAHGQVANPNPKARRIIFKSFEPQLYVDIVQEIRRGAYDEKTGKLTEFGVYGAICKLTVHDTYYNQKSFCSDLELTNL